MLSKGVLSARLFNLTYG
ncbi:protein YchT [Escherichia coli]